MVILFFFVSGGEICSCEAAYCHTNAAICDKCCSGQGYCHVDGVFCDDLCDELIFPQEDLIRRLRVISQ